MTALVDLGPGRRVVADRKEPRSPTHAAVRITHATICGPLIHLDAERRILDADGRHLTFAVSDRTRQAPELGRHGTPSADCLPPVSWRPRLLMQATLQPCTSDARSKPLILAGDAAPGIVEKIFSPADAIGLKACTVFQKSVRPGLAADRLQCSVHRADLHSCDTARKAD